MTAAPSLFPDLAEPAFVKAPDVKKLATAVLDKHDMFRGIREGIRDGKLSIAYVFETKHFDQLREEFKPHTIAKVTKAAPLWKAMTGFDLVIQFRRTFWQHFDERQREAVLHHELCHIDFEVEETGGVKLSLNPHDVEEFRATARAYGTALPGRRALVDAFSAWQREQPAAGIAQLRPVEDLDPDLAEGIVDALVDAVEQGAAAAAGLQSLADESGTEISITSRGRTARLTPKGGE